MNSTARAPRHTWVPWVAALAGAALTLKIVLIAAGGDGMSDTPFAVLYLSGLGLGLVAAVGVGLRQRGVLRSIGLGVGSAVLLLAWIMGLGEVLEPLIGLVTSSTTAQEEGPILVAGVVLLALAWRARARDLQAEAPVQAA
ncbi:MAG: hypothetical protein EPN99_02095 [Frankiales bacterium]|nr:MAG: hypothetical protein EPN99_02095 [Frankiales bacterium]